MFNIIMQMTLACASRIRCFVASQILARLELSTLFSAIGRSFLSLQDSICLAYKVNLVWTWPPLAALAMLCRLQILQQPQHLLSGA